MSSKTRWPSQASTNEVVDVPMSWDFEGAAPLTRTPMIVDGIDQSASIQGGAVRGVGRGAPGQFNILLSESWPWLFGSDLRVSTPLADTAPPYTAKLATDLTYQSSSAPFVRMYVYDATGVLADPPPGHTLVGGLRFRNRRVGS